MDLGLDRLIEMFEDRFGRPASTVLLLLIGLAAAVWAISFIVENLIIPLGVFAVQIAQYWRDGETHLSQQQIFVAITQLTLGMFGVLIFWVGCSVVVAWTKRKTASIIADARSIIADARKVAEDVNQFAANAEQQFVNSANQVRADTRKDCEEILEETEKTLKEAKAEAQAIMAETKAGAQDIIAELKRNAAEPSKAETPSPQSPPNTGEDTPQ